MNNRLVVVRHNVFIAIARAVVALFFSSELSSPVDAQVRVQSADWNESTGTAPLLSFAVSITL